MIFVNFKCLEWDLAYGYKKRKTSQYCTPVVASGLLMLCPKLNKDILLCGGIISLV